MSGGGNTTTVQKADPWSGVAPQLRSAAVNAEQMFGDGGFRIDPYQGQRVAGFGPTSQQGQNAILSAAAAPSASVAGQGALRDMMDGGNVYRDMDALRENVLGGAIPAATSMFSGSGRTDSGAAMDTVGRAAVNALAPYEYDAFNRGQENRLRAAALAPGVDQGAYLPGQMISAVGGQQDAMSQAMIDADMSRFYEGQNADPAALERYTGLLLGLGGQGGTSSATQPGASTGSRIAGAGMTGAGMFGALTGAGMGMPYAAPLAGLMALGSLF